MTGCCSSAVNILHLSVIRAFIITKLYLLDEQVSYNGKSKPNLLVDGEE